MKCLNCDTLFEGARYCPECGQRSATTRLSWRDILANIHHQLLEGNLPWPRTLWRMTLNPGEVAREFVGGKRVHYVHPLKYAFYLILIATFLVPAIGLGGGVPSYAVLPQWRVFLLENIPLFTLMVSPVAVVTLWLCFWKTYNMVEIWVLVLFLLGHLSLLFVVVAAVDVTIVRNAVGSEFMTAVIGASSILMVIVFYSWGVRGFFRTRLDRSLIGALISFGTTFWLAAMLYGWLMAPAT